MLAARCMPDRATRRFDSAVRLPWHEPLLSTVAFTSSTLHPTSVGNIHVLEIPWSACHLWSDLVSRHELHYFVTEIASIFVFMDRQSMPCEEWLCSSAAQM